MMQVASVIRNVYERAVRNCPWVGSLWTKYLLALERTSAPETEHAAVRVTPSVSLNLIFNVVGHVCMTQVHHVVQCVVVHVTVSVEHYDNTLSSSFLLSHFWSSILLHLGCTKALDSFCVGVALEMWPVPVL